MPQLNPEFWAAQIFWLLLIFSSLIFNYLENIFTKITLVLKIENLRIVNDINEAQKLKDGAEKKLKEYNKIIENSKKEAKKIIEESRKKLFKDIEIKIKKNLMMKLKKN